MQKKIRNVFEYKEYRLVLNDDFVSRVSGNHSYSLRAYARDIQMSSGFISDVLRGKRDLSPTKARKTFEKLGFKQEELDYVESLVVRKTSKDPARQQESLQIIERLYRKPSFNNDVEKDLILKSPDHFMIHGIVGGESDLQNILRLGELLAIRPERTLEIIKEFVREGFFEQKNNQYFILHPNLNIPSHAKLLKTQREYVNRLIDLMEAQGDMKMPERMGHYLVMGFDKDTLPLAGEAYKQLINTLSRLSNQTPVAERYGFFSSTFFTIPARAEGSTKS